MKPEIHPKYEEATFQCACGETFTTMSTAGGTHKMEICSKCHPFFTGKAKLVDTAGQIEKFRRRYAKAGQANAGS